MNAIRTVADLMAVAARTAPKLAGQGHRTQELLRPLAVWEVTSCPISRTW